jgi:hypothetical protein
MLKKLLSVVLTVFFILPVSGLLSTLQADIFEDGVLTSIRGADLPAFTEPGEGSRTVDIVGGTTNSSSGPGRAKGNSYQIDTDVILTEAEFWLDFGNTQMLTFYVFVCPDEFGKYNEIYRNSELTVGSGAAWYSTGPVAVEMDAGNHYIIIVSWDGTVGYYYDSGDSQATSFGYYTHGYATGSNPLPASFQSLSNDQAIYYQRLNTELNTSLEPTTWGAIKAAL